jgi:hypothetical protein
MNPGEHLDKRIKEVLEELRATRIALESIADLQRLKAQGDPVLMKRVEAEGDLIKKAFDGMLIPKNPFASRVSIVALRHKALTDWFERFKQNITKRVTDYIEENEGKEEVLRGVGIIQNALIDTIREFEAGKEE